MSVSVPVSLDVKQPCRWHARARPTHLSTDTINKYTKEILIAVIIFLVVMFSNNIIPFNPCDNTWQPETRHMATANRKLSPVTVPIYLVISHCKQDLFWLTNLTSVYDMRDIAIYSKCGYPVIGAPPRSRIMTLPNIGRCDHTYAYYISELKATEGIVIFAKDTTHVHNFQKGQLNGMNNMRSYQAMVEAASGPSQFSCRQFINAAVGISNEAISSYLVKYSISKYNLTFHNYTSKQDEPFSIHRNMMSWMQALGITLRQPLTPVCYGGIFAVNVERLQAIENKVWKGIRDSLSRADNIEEGHFMERSWAGMLSKEPLTPIRSAYNNGNDDTVPLCFRRNICGYRGHIVHSREKIKKHRLCARVPRSKILGAIHRCPFRPPIKQSPEGVRI